MDVVYKQLDFETLLRNSFKHGWLHKRNNRLRSIRKQARYFVLCEESLYWFKREKTKFVFKGECELFDMKLVEWNATSLQIQKKSSGKVYTLTGADIEEWARTLAAIIVPFTDFSTTLKELKMPEEYSNETASSSNDGNFSRKSTVTSSGMSSALSSLPALSDAASTPQADDLEDSTSFDETLIGRTILTKESLEKHNSTMESIEGPFSVNITPFEIFRDASAKSPTTEKAPDVQNAISFFENLSEPEELPRTKSELSRQRLFSKFGPETKGRLRSAKRIPASASSIGGETLPPSHVGECDDNASVSFEDDVDLEYEPYWLSKGLGRTNVDGSRTLNDLTHSLVSMMQTLNSLNDCIESQTQTNLFLFERACSLLPQEARGSSHERRSLPATTSDSWLLEREPTNERGGTWLDLPKHRRSMLSTSSDTELLRIPSERDCDLSRKQSSYRISIDYRARSSTQYTGRRSAFSLLSLQTADTDSISSIPDFDDISDMDERFVDIEQYIHSKLICRQPISMVELTNMFKGKRLPKEAFRKLYQKIRRRIEIDQRISRRQPENLSQLSLLYDHFVDLHSGKIEETGAREILKSRYVAEKMGQEELVRIKCDMLTPMDFQEFSQFLEDLPLGIGFKFRLALEEHVNAKTPFRRVTLRVSELDLVDFEEDGLTVERSTLACVEKGWSLVKLGEETIFTSQEKDSYLDSIEDTDEIFNVCFIAKV